RFNRLFTIVCRPCGQIIFIPLFYYLKLYFYVFNSQFKTALSALLFLLCLSWSCTKIDTTNLGQNLIPVVDNIHTFDTILNVIGNNFDSTVCESVNRSDLHALGVISDDPYFGKTTASFYLELKPQNFPFKFPASDRDSLLVDSVVLVLHYNHSYGDTNALQQVKVYPLNSPFKVDSSYTTCNVFGYFNSMLLGEKTYYPRDLNDSVKGFREASSNQLRIKLSNSFAQNFIEDSSIIFKSDTTFKINFNGFAIIADEMFGGNAINYFDLNNTDTRISFYLRSSVGTVKDTSVIDFSFTGLSGQANSVIHDRGTSEITSNLTHRIEGDSLIYIQTAPGTYAELKIPGLTGLSNRVIHRAELIVDQAYSPAPSEGYFTTPNYLYLDTKDISTNMYTPIPCDFTIVNLQPDFSYFGGFKKPVNDDNGHQVSQYVFNISRYVQSIVTKGSDNAVLRLKAPNIIINNNLYTDRCNQSVSPFNISLNTIADGRIKLNGTNNTSARMRLHIIYSTL
ncbi:MAG: DUF4270 family protein, partial [Ginsengibacter sp.]